RASSGSGAATAMSARWSRGPHWNALQPTPRAGGLRMLDRPTNGARRVIDTTPRVAWPTIAEAGRAAAESNARFDRAGEQPSAAALAAYRLALRTSTSAARDEFLCRVAALIVSVESSPYAEGIDRAAALLVRWLPAPVGRSDGR